MYNLEQAIWDWRQRMAAAGVENPDVLDELESHLREDLDKKLQSGLGLQQAFEAASKQLGQSAAVGLEFRKAEKARRAVLLKRLLFGVAVGFSAMSTFACLVVVPLVLRANAEYAAWLGLPKPQADMISVGRFVLCLWMGLAMPVGIVVVARAGVLSHQRLVGFRRHMIVVNLILAALLTTPEVATQILMFVPLQVLCEVGILLAGIWERRTPRHA